MSIKMHEFSRAGYGYIGNSGQTLSLLILSFFSLLFFSQYISLRVSSERSSQKTLIKVQVIYDHRLQ